MQQVRRRRVKLACDQVRANAVERERRTVIVGEHLRIGRILSATPKSVEGMNWKKFGTHKTMIQEIRLDGFACEISSDVILISTNVYS